MRSKKNKILIVIIFLLVVISSITFVGTYAFDGYDKIERVLKTDSYSYLPLAAQNYIKNVYNETNEIILTEKNKKKNTPYLNPKYVEYLSLSKQEQSEVSLIPDAYIVEYSDDMNIVTNSSFPSYYHLENVNGKNYLSPMYDQGNLGLCWAFASIEQAESYLMIKNNQSYNSLTSDRFSVRQMDYATSNHGINSYDHEWALRELSSGGNYYDSHLMMSYGMTLTDDNEWPYDDSIGARELSDVLNFANSKYELESSVVVPTLTVDSTDEDRESYNNLIKESIVKYGGAYVGTVSPASMCGFENIDGKYAMVDADGCGVGSGHAMHIVGWDDNYKYSYCLYDDYHLSVNSNGTCTAGTLISDTGAWIVKNSWGPSSSYKYVYLGYSSYGLSVAYATSLVSMEDRNWDNNYYDQISIDGFYYIYSSYDAVYNKKINTPEKLEKVKFISYKVGGNYSVSVKTATKSYDNIKTITVDHPGIYTFDLSDSNIILIDDEFTINVASTDGGKLLKGSISVFTSNIDNDVVIKTDDLNVDDLNINSNGEYELLVYSDTKNIDSNETLSYSLYKGDVDYSDYIKTVKNNKIAVNNANTTLVFNDDLVFDGYVLETSYDGYTSRSKLSLSVSQYDGSGTEDDPYLIYTERELRDMGNFPQAYYLLMNDITLTGEWESIGNDENPFTGGFDGGGHTIKGLRQTGGNFDYVGFFGLVVPKMISGDVTLGNAKTYVRNVTFEDVNISGGMVASVLIGGVMYVSNEITETDDYSSVIDIDGVNIIGGTIESSFGVGVLVAATFADLYSDTIPYLNINNVFSSVKMDGYHFSGLIGLIGYNEDSESLSTIVDDDASTVLERIVNSEVSDNEIFINLNMSNIQNVGEIVSYYDDEESFAAYSPGIGLISGNIEINLENYIFNSLIGNSEYMEYYADNKDTYFVGYHDLGEIQEPSYNISSGYYINKYYDENNTFTSSLDVKNLDLSSTWKEFDKYWKIETVDSIERTPVLKGIDYSYTSVSDILLSKDDLVSLLSYINNNSNYGYVSYEIISNDGIVSITDNLIDDITIKALKSGVAKIKVINHYDGFEKEVDILVFPIITYYKDELMKEGLTQEVVSNPISIMENEFTKEGYIFKEWNTKSDGTGISYQENQKINVTSDLILYAIWEPNKYQVSFDNNGGIGTMNNQEFTYGVSQKLNKNQFTKIGYVFKEWNTESNGFGITYKDNQEISVTSDLTLYAIWENENPFVIKGYKIDEVNKYIDMIEVNTDVDEFKNKIILSEGYTVDVDSVSIDGEDLLYTGGKTKIYKDGVLYASYTNVIRGDITGDGKINYLDYVYVYNHIYKTKHPESDKMLLDKENLLAADASLDDNVDYLDYVNIYNKIKELKGGSN